MDATHGPYGYLPNVQAILYFIAQILHLVSTELCKRLQATDVHERRLWTVSIIGGAGVLVIGVVNQNWHFYCALLVMLLSSSCATAVYYEREFKNTKALTRSTEGSPENQEQVNEQTPLQLAHSVDQGTW